MFPGSPVRFHPASQHFSNTPGLSYATTRNKWQLRIKNLTNRADAGVTQVRFETVKKFARSFEVVRVYAEPRIDERPDEPRPHSALMVRSIARSQIAIVLRFVVGFPRRKASQS